MAGTERTAEAGAVGAVGAEVARGNAGALGVAFVATLQPPRVTVVAAAVADVVKVVTAGSRPVALAGVMVAGGTMVMVRTTGVAWIGVLELAVIFVAGGAGLAVSVEDLAGLAPGVVASC